MKKVDKIDLSIIIISTNKNQLFDCLNSLIPAIKNISCEVILIDNASKQNLRKSVLAEFPFVQVIRREENGGFGENNNIGLKIAKGKYVLLLNDDTTIIEKNIFIEMIAWMDSHPKVGVSSCALLNKDGKTYQGSGGYSPTLLRVFAWMTFLDDLPLVDRLIKPYHPTHPNSPFYTAIDYHRKSHKQDWVTGAYFLMRKSALDEVGYFDEDFFLYVEEVDLSLRFIKAGWEIWYLPKWKIVHLGQVSTGNERALVDELKNLKILYDKHFELWKKPILTFLLKLGAFLRIFIFGIIKGKKVANIYIKAFTSL